MVDNVNNINPMSNGNPAHRLKKVYQGSAQAPRGTDGVQISPELQKLKQMDGIRLDKVLAVRKALQDGSYLTPEKLDKALDSAIDDAYSED